MSLPDETPLFIPDPVEGPLLGTSHARAKRSRKGEMTAVWIILGVAGVCCLGYAVHLAFDTSPEPAVTPESTAVVAPPSSTGDDNFGDDTVKLEALRHRLNDRRHRAEVPVRKSAVPEPEPAVEVVVEPERPAPAPETPASFDNGSAFDRPSVDSSRTRRRAGSSREFGTYQAPAGRERAPESDRPNQPDPSFDEMPGDRPMLRKGARR